MGFIIRTIFVQFDALDRLTFITQKQIVSEHRINQYIDINTCLSNI